MKVKDDRFTLESIYFYIKHLSHIEANRASWDKMFDDNAFQDKPRDKQDLVHYYDGYMDGFEKAWLMFSNRINGHGDFYRKEIPGMSTTSFYRLLGFTKDRLENNAEVKLDGFRKVYQDDWDLIMKYRKKVANLLSKMDKELDERDSLL